MMSNDNTITPIEYVQDDWHGNTAVIIWHGDSIVSNVCWQNEDTYTREGYNVTYRDEYYIGGSVKVDKYDCCLRIESSAPEYIREQCRELIEKMGDETLLETFENLRQCVEWGVG